MEALEDPKLGIRVLEREPCNLEEALNAAQLFESFERGKDELTWANITPNYKNRYARSAKHSSSMDITEDLASKQVQHSQQLVLDLGNEINMLSKIYSESMLLMVPARTKNIIVLEVEDYL